MIALMHLREDYRAGGLANRLALEYPGRIYIVPKDYRRVWSYVRNKLREAEAGIFLMVDEGAYIDRATINDLSFMAKLGKPIYMLVPESVARRFKSAGWDKLDNVKILTFNPWDIESIRSLIKNTIKSNEKNDIWIIMGLALFILLVMIVMSSKK